MSITASLCALAALPCSAAEPVLRIGLTQEPATLNPIVGTLAIETDVYQLLFSGLFRYDDHGNQVPDLAREIPSRANGGISPDGKTITWRLLHNAKFSDGVPLTSEDVKFTYSAIVNPKTITVGGAPFENIERIDTPDPYTVKIVLRRPWAPALVAFGNNNEGAIVPAHLLAKYEDLNHVDFAGAPVGSGPYRLVAWHRGSDMTFEPNPYYFRSPPKIKRVVIRFLTSDNTMMVALRTHELDLGDRLTISTYVNLGSIPGMLPAINTQSFWEHLTFNAGRPPLDDPRLRLALCYGFDVREIYAKIAHGIGSLAPTSENPATMWYDRRLDYYPFDPRKAARILEDAGWKVGPDGIRVKNGRRLSLTMVSIAGNITREQTEVILQDRWRAIGVEVTIKNGPAPMVFALAANGGPLYSGNFDVALSAFIDNNSDPNRWNFNHADRVPPKGNNISFYRDPELSRIEDAAAGTYDVVVRKRLYDRAQEIELKQLPYYVIRWAANTDVRSAALKGVRPTIVSSNLWNIADWELSR